MLPHFFLYTLNSSSILSRGAHFKQLDLQFSDAVQHGRWKHATSPPWLLDNNSGLSTLIVPHIIDEDGCAKAMAPSDWNNDK